jgi:RNA 2',3'-cyclic 3'-phosphodiesterase
MRVSAGGSEFIRTFIAIEIPESIKAKMAEIQAALRKSGADVGWTRPEGIHLTLKFLGPVEAGMVEDISDALEAALGGEKAFSLEVTGIGVFPSPRAPRVIWIGLGGELDAAKSLYEKVESVCEGFEFAREKRAFTPHLTLGRVRSHKGVGALMKEAEKYEKVELGSFTASSVSVMKSELKPSGAVYTEMRQIKFA